MLLPPPPSDPFHPGWYPVNGRSQQRGRPLRVPGACLA